MIAGQLDNWKSHPGLSNHPLWSEAFTWIEKNAATAEEGVFPLEHDGAYVRVMGYETKVREDANYENHLQTIDLQYTISGAEGIEITPVSHLVKKGKYLEENDFQFYETPDEEFNTGFVKNVQGNFCILFPEDGHQPQRQINGLTEVKKLVVKIPVSAIS